MNHATTSTRTTPLLPTLPFELVENILYRLPVKLLLQLRCICKQWKSWISSTEFTTNYLRMAKASKNHHHLMLTTKTELPPYNKFLLDSPIPSIFTTLSPPQTPLTCPHILDRDYFHVCSCDGILCFTICEQYPLLWNPSIRTFNVIPPVKNMFPTVQTSIIGRRRIIVQRNMYSFGYDITTHKYKIVALSFLWYRRAFKVCIYTLGSDPTNSWKRIQDFPDRGSISEMGLFVSGTINWLVSGHIVSLNLATETYQQLLLPTTTREGHVTLGVLKDCLCIFGSSNMSMVDVWIMKEFGNNESWINLYSVPYMRGDEVRNAKVLYVTEDDHLLMYCVYLKSKALVVYDSRNGTFNMSKLQHYRWWDPIVYFESFISP